MCELEEQGKIEVICPGTLKSMTLHNNSGNTGSSGLGFTSWAELVLGQGDQEVHATARLVVVSVLYVLY